MFEERSVERAKTVVAPGGETVSLQNLAVDSSKPPCEGGASASRACGQRSQRGGLTTPKSFGVGESRIEQRNGRNGRGTGTQDLVSAGDTLGHAGGCECWELRPPTAKWKVDRQRVAEDGWTGIRSVTPLHGATSEAADFAVFFSFSAEFPPFLRSYSSQRALRMTDMSRISIESLLT